MCVCALLLLGVLLLLTTVCVCVCHSPLVCPSPPHRATLDDIDGVRAATKLMLKHILVAGGARTCADELELVLASGGPSYRVPAPAPFWMRSGLDVHAVATAVGVGAVWLILAACARCARTCGRTHKEKAA